MLQSSADKVFRKMPFARLLQGLVGIAAGDVGGVTGNDGDVKTGGEMVDNQSMATMCLTTNCGTSVTRGRVCHKCNVRSPANTGSL